MFAKCRYLQWALILFLVGASNSFAGDWEQVSELPTWRRGMAAAAVNGKIYLTGGFDHHKNLGGGAPALSTVDVYDTRTNTWRKAASMPTARISAKAAVFSTDIYVFGGREEMRGEYTKIVEMYDTRTDTWVKKRDMPTRRKGFVTAVVDGKIYIIGGSIRNKKLGKREATGIIEVYDPVTNRWEKRASMPTEREWAKAEVVDGKVYVLGGEVSFAGPLGARLVNAIEAYNPKTNTWRKRPDIPMPKCWFETAVVDNEIWTIGGYDPNNGFRHIDAVDVYNPIVNKWRKGQPLTVPKSTTAAVVNGTIYLLGGWLDSRNSIFSPIVEAYDTGFLAVNPKGKLPGRWGELKKQVGKK